MVLCPVKVFVLEDSNINFFAHWQPFRTYFFVKKKSKKLDKNIFHPKHFCSHKKVVLNGVPSKNLGYPGRYPGRMPKCFLSTLRCTNNNDTTMTNDVT